MSMKFSIFLPSGFVRDFQGFSDPVDAYERIVEIAKTADDAGYAALVCPDHLTTIPPSHDALFDAWTLIAWMEGTAFYALAGAGAAVSPALDVLRDQVGRLLATMIGVAPPPAGHDDRGGA